jgi:hypothetical protein
MEKAIVWTEDGAPRATYPAPGFVERQRAAGLGDEQILAKLIELAIPKECRASARIVSPAEAEAAMGAEGK